MPRTGSVLLNETDITGPRIRYSQRKKWVCVSGCVCVRERERENSWTLECDRKRRCLSRDLKDEKLLIDLCDNLFCY